jgi:phosphate-selective porin OprO/OprP
MKTHVLAATLALLACSTAPAAGFDDWPVHHAFGDGSDLALSGAWRYDNNTFSNDRRADGSSVFEDAATLRRKELALVLKKPGVYDAVVSYEFKTHAWLDTFLRLQSTPLAGRDIGAFRIGYSKTPVSFEAGTPTRATSFLELALPSQALFEGRRTGIDWQLERPAWIANVGAYAGQDLHGDNDGTTFAARLAWTPRKAAGDVLHLGLSASQEERDATTDGRGIRHPAVARFGTPPETGLTPVRLVDTGVLADAGRIRRAGLEGLWIRGPWSVQGEWLAGDVARQGNAADFHAAGWYVFGSWIATGESRPYGGGNTGNVKPQRPWGAWELLLRYSELDLDDGAVRGGREHDWTLGANWYLTQHFKLQGNLVRATSERGNLEVDPHIVELRAQVQF